MLGIDPKVARYTWTAAAVLLLLFLIYKVRGTLLVFILALLFAYLLSPVVDFLDRWLTGSRSRTLALAIAYVLFVGGVTMISIHVGGEVAEQASSLANRMPELVTQWQQPIPGAPAIVNSLKDQVIEQIRRTVAEPSDWIAALPKAGMKFVTIAGNLLFVIVVPILAFFFLKDAAAIRRHILDMTENSSRRALLDDVMADVHVLLLQYMRALVILAFATFVAYNAAFWILGVPYGVLLAVIASLLEFFPLIGPLSAAILILVMAASTGGHLLAVLVFLGAYRLFQDYVLSPLLMKKGVEIHPLLVLFGVFAGEELAGVAGIFLSVPVLALVRLLYLRFRKQRIRMPAESEVLQP